MKKYVRGIGIGILYSTVLLCSCSQHPPLKTAQVTKIAPLTVNDFMQPVAIPLDPLKKPVDRAKGQYVELPPRPTDDFIEEVLGSAGIEITAPAAETPTPAAETETAPAAETPTPAAETETAPAAETPTPAAETETAPAAETPTPAAGTETAPAAETPTPAAEDLTQRLYVYRVKYQPAVVLKAMLEAAYAGANPPPVFVAPDAALAAAVQPPAPTVNSDLIIRATRPEYAQIKTLLAKIDRPPMQVYLDVLIAEVVMTDQESLGMIIDLFLKGQIAAGGNHLPVESWPSTFFTDVAAEGVQGLSYSIASPGVFAALIRALAKTNRLKVLSEPHIFAHNNTEAKISVGQKVPIKTSTTSGTTVTESVSQQDVAITLTVTPRVIHDGTVLLKLTQAVNDVSSENYQGTGAPLVTTRELTTSVVARDGMTVLMGGLISEKRYLDRKGVPLLQDIPFLGRLFRNDVNTEVKDELLVLLTPYIMWTPAHEAFYTNMMNQYVSPWKDDDLYLERNSEKVKRMLQKIQGEHK